MTPFVRLELRVGVRTLLVIGELAPFAVVIGLGLRVRRWSSMSAVGSRVGKLVGRDNQALDDLNLAGSWFIGGVMRVSRDCIPLIHGT